MEVGLGKDAFLTRRPKPQPELTIGALDGGLHSKPGQGSMGRRLATGLPDCGCDAALLVR